MSGRRHKKSQKWGFPIRRDYLGSDSEFFLVDLLSSFKQYFCKYIYWILCGIKLKYRNNYKTKDIDKIGNKISEFEDNIQEN